MLKVILLAAAAILSISPIYRDQADTGFIPLHLNCVVNFGNYNGIDETSTTRQSTLNSHKHKTGGSNLVVQTKFYKFWVMTHGVQTITNRAFIREFQVAVRHKQSGLFMHALSDMASSPDIPPKRARISLVNYHPDTTLEKGELLFECSSIDRSVHDQH